MIVLTGCMSASQKFQLAEKDANTRATLAEQAPAVIKAATSFVMCGVDPVTLQPIEGANCAGLYVQIGAGQDEIIAITHALTPAKVVTGAEAARDVGVAVVNGIFSPTTALAAVGMYGIKHAGDDSSVTSVDSNNTNTAVAVESNTLGITDNSSTSTVRDISDIGNQKDNYGSGNTAGNDQGIANESAAGTAPVVDFSPQPPIVIVPEPVVVPVL
jgi:hypothetical protein